MNHRDPISAADLHVMLERAFRRESRNCHACTFSLHGLQADNGPGDWSVIPAQACSDDCRNILEDLVARYRDQYRLEAVR